MSDIKDEPNKKVSRGCIFSTSEQGESVAAVDEGCFKLHEYNWMEGYPENDMTDLVEVRFKNTRRSYYRNEDKLELSVGDIVAVEASPGHDIGVVSMMGDLVLRQIKRTGFNPFNGEFKKIYRKAKPQDIEHWMEAIACEHSTMIKSRQIAAQMGLDMKIGDVEYQGDNMKAIFYYIADGRVDFRELIKVFAEQFRVRIEMKQIGARQEAGRIGGIGACGRELCCASWISSFSSVTTSVARLQNLSLNPLKLAGQCSKLKCCLMYEYDSYAEARKQIPQLREPLHAADGDYFLQKVDVLARTMSFSTSKDEMVNVVTIPVERVWHIIGVNKRGEKVDSIVLSNQEKTVEEPSYRHEEDSITRFDHTKKNKKKKGRNHNEAEKDNREQMTSETQSENSPANDSEKRPERKSKKPTVETRAANSATETKPKQSHGTSEQNASMNQDGTMEPSSTKSEDKTHYTKRHRHRNSKPKSKRQTELKQ